MLREVGAERVVGIDYAEEAIRQATEQTNDPEIEFHCVDVFEFSPNTSFDVVVPTYIHDDHACGIPHLLRHYLTQCWALDEVARGILAP